MSRSIRVPRDLRCRGRRRAFRRRRWRAPAGAVCGRGVGLRAVRPGAAGVPRPAARPRDRIVRRPDRSLPAFGPGLDADRGQEPQVRARARQRAATTDGIVVDTRARIGYTAPIGTTDDARLRQLTVALPPQYAARLFDAQQQGADERRLMEITAEGLKEVYFQDAGRRAGSLEEVRFTDVEHVDFEL
ncbi:telomere-protecting terminal protein Tpg [Streptomyces werraensis]|uniref:telomere-protecting terminal protein Tpg n=1 Tax=Streptomyces werraensis TaxID=68284 RepID=UPI0037D1B16F